MVVELDFAILLNMYLLSLCDALSLCFIASIDFGMGRTGSCAWCYPQCQDSCLPTVWVVAWPRWPLEIGDWNTGCHWLSLAVTGFCGQRLWLDPRAAGCAAALSP